MFCGSREEQTGMKTDRRRGWYCLLRDYCLFLQQGARKTYLSFSSSITQPASKTLFCSWRLSMELLSLHVSAWVGSDHSTKSWVHHHPFRSWFIVSWLSLPSNQVSCTRMFFFPLQWMIWRWGMKQTKTHRNNDYFSTQIRCYWQALAPKFDSL